MHKHFNLTTGNSFIGNRLWF